MSRFENLLFFLHYWCLFHINLFLIFFFFCVFLCYGSFLGKWFYMSVITMRHILIDYLTNKIFRIWALFLTINTTRRFKKIWVLKYNYFLHWYAFTIIVYNFVMYIFIMRNLTLLFYIFAISIVLGIFGSFLGEWFYMSVTIIVYNFVMYIFVMRNLTLLFYIFAIAIVLWIFGSFLGKWFYMSVITMWHILIDYFTNKIFRIWSLFLTINTTRRFKKIWVLKYNYFLHWYAFTIIVFNFVMYIFNIPSITFPIVIIMITIFFIYFFHVKKALMSIFLNLAILLGFFGFKHVDYNLFSNLLILINITFCLIIACRISLYIDFKGFFWQLKNPVCFIGFSFFIIFIASPLFQIWVTQDGWFWFRNNFFYPEKVYFFYNCIFFLFLVTLVVCTLCNLYRSYLLYLFINAPTDWIGMYLYLWSCSNQFRISFDLCFIKEIEKHSLLSIQIHLWAMTVVSVLMLSFCFLIVKYSYITFYTAKADSFSCTTKFLFLMYCKEIFTYTLLVLIILFMYIHDPFDLSRTHWIIQFAPTQSDFMDENSAIRKADEIIKENPVVTNTFFVGHWAPLLESVFLNNSKNTQAYSKLLCQASKSVNAAQEFCIREGPSAHRIECTLFDEVTNSRHQLFQTAVQNSPSLHTQFRNWTELCPVFHMFDEIFNQSSLIHSSVPEDKKLNYTCGMYLNRIMCLQALSFFDPYKDNYVDANNCPFTEIATRCRESFASREKTDPVINSFPTELLQSPNYEDMAKQCAVKAELLHSHLLTKLHVLYVQNFVADVQFSRVPDEDRLRFMYNQTVSPVLRLAFSDEYISYLSSLADRTERAERAAREGEWAKQGYVTQRKELETVTASLEKANASLETVTASLDTANASLEKANASLDTANASLEKQKEDEQHKLKILRMNLFFKFADFVNQSHANGWDANDPHVRRNFYKLAGATQFEFDRAETVWDKYHKFRSKLYTKDPFLAPHSNITLKMCPKSGETHSWTDLALESRYKIRNPTTFVICETNRPVWVKAITTLYRESDFIHNQLPTDESYERRLKVFRRR